MIKISYNDWMEKVSNEYKVEVTEDGVSYDAVCHNATVRQRTFDIDAWKALDYGIDKNYQMSFALIESDFLKPLSIRIHKATPYHKCNILPRGKVQWKEIDDTTIEFVLTKPEKLSIEFDDNLYTNLFLYFENFESETIQKGENVIYFEKGVHDAGRIDVKEGQTLYLEAGAVVYGYVVAEGNNITIAGKGILCGEKIKHGIYEERFEAIYVLKCTGLTIKDVILIDSSCWNINLTECKNVLIDNVKEICYNANSDGLDLCGTSDVLVKNCFFRNHDDNVSVKPITADCKNILITDCIFWSDRAHVMLIGPESDCTKNFHNENIKFCNIQVLYHKEYHPMFQGVMAIFCADNATVKNITWENIVVERVPFGKLVSIIYTTEYAKALGKELSDIYFNNIHCYSDTDFISWIKGLDEEHTVNNIVIKDFYIRGEKQTKDNNEFLTNQFVGDLKFE